MNWLYDIFSKAKSSSGFLFVVILTFIYFSVYAVKGERGLMRYIYLTSEVSQAKETADKYAKEKTEWEEKVKLLSSDSLDLDMLDERARVVLNMVGEDEFIILDNGNITK